MQIWLMAIPLTRPDLVELKLGCLRDYMRGLQDAASAARRSTTAAMILTVSQAFVWIFWS